MNRPKFDILSYSRLLVGVAILVMFLLGILQVAQGFIDTRDYSENILKVIKQQTGRDAVIKGKVHVALLPTPSIFIPQLELHDTENADTPAASIELVTITTSFLSMFSDQPTVTGVVLQHPTLEIQRNKKGAMVWGWLNYDLFKSLLGNQANGVALDVYDGKLVYTNNRQEEETSVTGISFDGRAGARPSFSGEFEIRGQKFEYRLKSSGDGGEAGVPFEISLTHNDMNTVQMKGRMELQVDDLKINGKLDASIKDILSWNAPPGSDSRFDALITGRSTERKPGNEPVMPLSVSADYYQDSQVSVLKNLSLDVANSKASGDIRWIWTEKPAVEANMDFESLDYDQWALLAKKMAGNNVAAPSAGEYTYHEDEIKNPIPAEIAATVNITSKRVAMGSKNWENVRLAASMDHSVITVNQLSVDLPGQSSLTLFGVISQSSTKDIRFEGSMEAQGRELKEVLPAFDESISQLPDIGLDDFFVRSNLFISSRQVRLSEADLKIGALHLNGGLVAYSDESPRIEADIKLKDINFDYFRDEWRKRQQAQAPDVTPDYFFRIDRSSNLEWLRRLRTSIDFKVYVEGFTFLERTGDTASFRLFAKDGEMGIYNVKFNYPDETAEVSFNVNVNDEEPRINVVVNTNELNLDYFMPVPHSQPDTPPQPPVNLLRSSYDNDEDTPNPWSVKLIDMSWLNGMSGVFDVTIGTLRHGNLLLDQFKMRAKLDKDVLNFQALSFVYWRGKVDLQGSIYGGNVPGVALSFTFYNGELQDLLYGLAGRSNITGKISISGSLATSGVNLLSWLEQAESKILFNAAGVEVGDFNMQGVLDAVAVSRTSADVFNNVNRALSDGSTRMTAEGNINLKNTVMKTPGITLKIDDITGNLTGEVKLLPWKMDLSAFFQFRGLPSETVPTMTVQMVGPINMPELHTDTSSLEAYVAKRIISK